MFFQGRGVSEADSRTYEQVIIQCVPLNLTVIICRVDFAAIMEAVGTELLNLKAAKLFTKQHKRINYV